MTDVPQGGAPPLKKRRSRPAPTGTALVKDTSNANCTTPADAADADFLGMCDFAGFDGPIILLEQIGHLIADLPPAWLVVGLIDDAPDWLRLAPAMRLARHILTAPDLRDISAIAGRLAANGNQVVAIEWPTDVEWPAIEQSASAPSTGRSE